MRSHPGTARESTGSSRGTTTRSGRWSAARRPATREHSGVQMGCVRRGVERRMRSVLTGPPCVTMASVNTFTCAEEALAEEALADNMSLDFS